MAHCVFMHKVDSIYDDIPAKRYHFPAICLFGLKRRRARPGP
jgi:hypothetical protein